MAGAAGLRVIRGPGWSQGNADSGEGHVGTVVAAKDDGTAEVTWDNGKRTTVKSGSEIRVLDNAPVGIRHQGVVCDECHESNMVGMRWKCSQCHDFELCSLCYFSDRHDTGHQFLRIETPASAPVKLEKRSKSLNMRVMGIFPEATVVRGKDWEFGNQDGGAGKEGVVEDLLTPSVDSARSTVRVRWNSGGNNVYRVGFKGKVDLQFTEQAPGGDCYPHHLPVFDPKLYAQRAVALAGSASHDSGLKEGDRAYLDLPPERVQQLKQSRSDVVQVLGKVGKVQGVTGGEAIITFGPKRFKISCNILRKVLQFSVGDRVQVLSDEDKVSEFQDGHGGYNDNMRSSLGKVGDVIKIDSDDDVVVQFEGQKWVYNPACLIPAPGKPVDKVSTEGGGIDSGLSGLNLLMGALALAAASQARQEMGSMVFLKAIIDGETSAVRQMLQRDQRLVRTSAEGIGALHIAANQGHVQITKLLVENRGEINEQDKEGDTPLLAGMKYDIIADYLIKKGCDVNVANEKGLAAAHKAAGFGHTQILRLLASKGADFNAQDNDGDTPLHVAIMESQTATAEVLIGHPKTDLRRKNNKGFSPLQMTALKGIASITELLISRDISLVNEQKQDGFTALHIAAVNNHTDVMKILLEKGKASVDIKDKNRQTALHLACNQAYMDAVQMLVKRGADVESKDEDGDRPLHILLITDTGPMLHGHLLLMLLVGQAPKVKEEERVRIACYLLQAGADPEARNDKGQTALDACQNASIVASIRRFMANNPDLGKRRLQRPSSAARASGLCRKCNKNRASILMVPCGCKAACGSCASSLRACPQCQSFIRSMHDEAGKEIKDKCLVM